jgi:hypothetical protein
MKRSASVCIVLAFLGSGVLAAGCNRDDEQARITKEKQDAAEKIAAAQREADEKKAAAERDVAEAERKGEEQRREARAELERDIADIDRKAVAMKASAAKATGKAKLNNDAALAEYEKRRAVLEADMKRLGTATGAVWDTAKLDARQHIASTKEALDSLDRTVNTTVSANR